MNTGKLDRRVTVQTYTASRDQYGEVVKSWSNDSIRWAHFKAQLKPSAAFGNPEVQGQPVMRSMGLFTFRGTPAVFSQDFRLSFSGKTWHPVQIGEQGTRGEWTTILCEAFDNTSLDG
jgi:head-tail adaptor